MRHIKAPNEWPKPKYHFGESVLVNIPSLSDPSDSYWEPAKVAGLVWRPDGKEGWWYSLIYLGMEHASGLDPEEDIKKWIPGYAIA